MPTHPTRTITTDHYSRTPAHRWIEVKFIPGVGMLVGGAINATIAGGFTMAMGTAWALVCEQLVQGGLRAVDGALDVDAIRNLFG